MLNIKELADDRWLTLHDYGLSSEVTGIKFEQTAILTEKVMGYRAFREAPLAVRKSHRWLVADADWQGNLGTSYVTILVTYVNGKYHIIYNIDEPIENNEYEFAHGNESVDSENELFYLVAELLSFADKSEYNRLVEFGNDDYQEPTVNESQPISEEPKPMDADEAMDFFTEPIVEKFTINFTKQYGQLNLDISADDRAKLSENVLNSLQWLNISENNIDISITYVDKQFYMLNMINHEFNMITANDINDVYIKVLMLLKSAGNDIYNKFVTEYD